MSEKKLTLIAVAVLAFVVLASAILVLIEKPWIESSPIDPHDYILEIYRLHARDTWRHDITIFNPDVVLTKDDLWWTSIVEVFTKETNRKIVIDVSDKEWNMEYLSVLNRLSREFDEDDSIVTDGQWFMVRLYNTKTDDYTYAYIRQILLPVSTDCFWTNTELHCYYFLDNSTDTMETVYYKYINCKNEPYTEKNANDWAIQEAFFGMVYD